MTALPRLFFLLLIIVLMSLPLRAEDGDDASDDPHHSHREGRQALPLEELQMFADVFNQIRQGYVESVPDSELFELAVQGMLSGLDPHSVFLKEKAYDSLQETTAAVTVGSNVPIAALVIRQNDDPTVQFPDEVPSLTVFPVIPGRADGTADSAATIQDRWVPGGRPKRGAHSSRVKDVVDVEEHDPRVLEDPG